MTIWFFSYNLMIDSISRSINRLTWSFLAAQSPEIMLIALWIVWRSFAYLVKRIRGSCMFYWIAIISNSVLFRSYINSNPSKTKNKHREAYFSDHCWGSWLCSNGYKLTTELKTVKRERIAGIHLVIRGQFFFFKHWKMNCTMAIWRLTSPLRLDEISSIHTSRPRSTRSSRTFSCFSTKKVRARMAANTKSDELLYFIHSIIASNKPCLHI